MSYRAIAAFDYVDCEQHNRAGSADEELFLQVFDIHEYGECILNNLSDATSEQPKEASVGFAAVVINMEKHQASYSPLSWR